MKIYKYKFKYPITSSKHTDLLRKPGLCLNYDPYEGIVRFRLPLPPEIADDLGLEFIEEKEI